jgi:hypothetical protein
VNDLVALGVIVVALYLSECVVWARHGAFVVTAPFLFGWSARLRPLSRLAGTTRGAFTFLNPLPPFGHVYVVEPLPFTLHVDRVVASRAFSLAHEPLPEQSGRVLAWDDVKDARAVDRDVYMGGTLFAHCSTPRHARAAAAVLTRIATASDRASAIDEEMRAHFDVAEARARAQRHARWSLPLLIGASGVFVALFVFVPRVAIATGTKHWPVMLAAVYAWVLVCVVSMFVAHKKLAPLERGERWMQTLLMVPAPTMALRGNDKLGRGLMAGLHPIAVALAVLQGGARDDVIGRALRELKHPRGGHAHDAALLARVTLLARSEGVDVDSAFAPPKLREGQGAWCPRCRAPYRAGTAACADCSIALVAA